MNTFLKRANVFSPYENTPLETYGEYAKRKGAIPFEDLAEQSAGGVPVASFRDADGKLKIVFAPESHELIIGSTRSGKTTGYIVPMIMMKASQKIKDSMFITDAKGELYQTCSEYLRSQGYRVILMNFRDYNHSEYWNPLTPIYRKYRKAMELEKAIEIVKTENGYSAVLLGKKYDSEEALSDALNREKQIILNDVYNEIDTLAVSVITSTNQRDPYWELSSRQLLQALLYGMLEDSDPETAGNRMVITEETFSFRTLMRIYETFRYDRDSSDGDNGFFTSRPEGSRALTYATTSILANANNTRMCVLSTFNAKMAQYKEIVTNIVTSCNSFELDELASEKKPVAIFIVYRDEVRTSYDTVRQFIVATYTKLIEIANAQPGLRLKRPFFFLLDEFGNLPAITDFDTTISACGGRNIWYVLVLQSYAQLENQYNRETAAIIRENLNYHVFFGTNNAQTKKAFSEECGRKTILSPKSVFAGDANEIAKVTFEEVSTVPVSNLNRLETGECYITMSNAESVLRSHMERSYLCPEYACPKGKLSDYRSDVDVFDPQYLYKTPAKEKPAGRVMKRRFSDFF